MILFFRTPSNNVIAIEMNHVADTEEIQKLCWLFGDATPESEENLKGYFVGPRKEMITPWSTNAVEYECRGDYPKHGIGRCGTHRGVLPRG